MNVGLADFIREAANIPPPDHQPKFRCGHPKTPENTYDKSGPPRCLECKRENARHQYFKKRMGIR